ncbi:MAG TPA: Gfo/Idh/MocA family oxidoreductase [Firmicutes bacterium]|nr:Gfo/Idh/MocA family oxidoreductase [Bacillota bacterium]
MGNMQQTKRRIGFIGAGGNARGHMRNMMQVPGAQVVALADPSPASLAAAVKVTGEGVSTYEDYRRMIAEETLDGVVISTPHTLHYEQVMTCLDKGLHVLIEKPMTCTSAHARDIIQKAAETGKVVLIGYQRHYEPRFRWVKKQIKDGLIGRVTFVQCFQSQNWLRSQQGKWRLDPALSGGGQLNDSGSHLVDIILWVTGLEADTVTAFVDKRGEAVDINSAVTVKFTNGAIGNISVVGDQVANGFWEDIIIAGEKGMIWLPHGGKVFVANEAAMTPQEVTDFGDEPVTNKDQNFIDCINGAAANEVPPICGLKVIELTEAIWRSMDAEGLPVKVERS